MPYEFPTPEEAVKLGDAPLVPNKCYRVHCLEVKTGRGKKEPYNKMSTLKVEILSPPEVTNQNGLVSQTAGIKGDMYVAFSAKNAANVAKFLGKIGVKYTNTGDSEDAVIDGIQAAIAEQLPGLTWEMRLASKKEDVLDAQGKVITRSDGVPIAGYERVDFSMFNVEGLPLRIENLGALAVTNRPY